MLLLKYYKRNCSNFQRIKTILREKQPGDDLGVRGWINNIRRLKNHIFLDINDGSTAAKFQILTERTENTKQLSAGNLIDAEGILQVAPRGNFELHAHTVRILADGHLTSGYPFIPKHQHPPDYVRDFLHLRSRIDYIAAVMRLRHRVQKVLHDFMDANDFIQINTPVITTNDCEGAGEVFTLRPENTELLKQMYRKDIPIDNSYFDNKVYLSVSGQLHLESMSYGLGNTYTLSPAFRAENCKSPLHLSEFYMLEAELVFMNNLNELCSFIERMLKSITQDILNTTTALDDIHHCQKLALGKTITIDWLEKPWQLINYKEAFTILEGQRNKLQTALNANENFSKEQELRLVEHFNSPVFVIDWPSTLKPFYMMSSRQDVSIVHAVDLLMPVVGELCGGGLRESDEERLRQHTQLPANLDWYVDLRKYGSAPTGGFGMGFERYLQLLTGIKNIRDVIPFPRYPHSCKM